MLNYHPLVALAKRRRRPAHEALRDLGTTGIHTPIRLVGMPAGPTVHAGWLTAFGTHSGKAELHRTPWSLFSDFYEAIRPRDGELWVTSGRASELWQSSYDDGRKPTLVRRWPDRGFAEVHPEDAARAGIESGDLVALESDVVFVQTGGFVEGDSGSISSFTKLREAGRIGTERARCEAVAIVTDAVRPELVFTNFLHPGSASNSLVHRVPDPTEAWPKGCAVPPRRMLRAMEPAGIPEGTVVDCLRAEAPELTRVVREQRSRLLWTALACFGVAAVVLAIEYRVMILTLLALLPPAVLYGDLRRLKKTARDGFVELRWSEEGVTIETTAGRAEAALADVAMRVTPRFLVLSRRLPQPNRFEVWAIPAAREALGAAAQALSALGFHVTVERGAVATGALVAGGVILLRVLAVVAVCLVAGGLANIGLWALGRAGSLWLGLLLIAGALVALTGAVLIRVFFGRG